MVRIEKSVNLSELKELKKESFQGKWYSWRCTYFTKSSISTEKPFIILSLNLFERILNKIVKKFDLNKFGKIADLTRESKTPTDQKVNSTRKSFLGSPDPLERPSSEIKSLVKEEKGQKLSEHNQLSFIEQELTQLDQVVPNIEEIPSAKDPQPLKKSDDEDSLINQYSPLVEEVVIDDFALSGVEGSVTNLFEKHEEPTVEESLKESSMEEPNAEETPSFKDSQLPEEGDKDLPIIQQSQVMEEGVEKSPFLPEAGDRKDSPIEQPFEQEAVEEKSAPDLFEKQEEPTREETLNESPVEEANEERPALKDSQLSEESDKDLLEELVDNPPLLAEAEDPKDSPIEQTTVEQKAVEKKSAPVLFEKHEEPAVEESLKESPVEVQKDERESHLKSMELVFNPSKKKAAETADSPKIIPKARQQALPSAKVTFISEEMKYINLMVDKVLSKKFTNSNRTFDLPFLTPAYSNYLDELVVEQKFLAWRFFDGKVQLLPRGGEAKADERFKNVGWRDVLKIKGDIQETLSIDQKSLKKIKEVEAKYKGLSQTTLENLMVMIAEINAYDLPGAIRIKYSDGNFKAAIYLKDMKLIDDFIMETTDLDYIMETTDLDYKKEYLVIFRNVTDTPLNLILQRERKAEGASYKRQRQATPRELKLEETEPENPEITAINKKKEWLQQSVNKIVSDIDPNADKTFDLSEMDDVTSENLDLLVSDNKFLAWRFSNGKVQLLLKGEIAKEDKRFEGIAWRDDLRIHNAVKVKLFLDEKAESFRKFSNLPETQDSVKSKINMINAYDLPGGLIVDNDFWGAISIWYLQEINLIHSFKLIDESHYVLYVNERDARGLGYQRR